MAGQTSFSTFLGSEKTYSIDKQPLINSYIWQVYTDPNLTLLAVPADVALTSLGAGRENEVHVVWNKAGTFYLSIRAIDNTGCINRMAMTFNVIDNSPIVRDDFNATIETLAVDQSDGSGNILSNDSVAGGSELTILKINNDTTGTLVGDYGTLVWDKSGSYTYTPNLALDSMTIGEEFNEIFSVSISKGVGNPVNSRLTIKITGENDYPVLVDDTNSTIETNPTDQSKGSGNLLANDSDPDWDVLSVLSIEGDVLGAVTGVYGILNWNPDGNYTYQPNPELDSLTSAEKVIEVFYVTVSDGHGGVVGSSSGDLVRVPLGAPRTAVSSLTITINGENDLPVLSNDVNSTVEANPVNEADGSGNLLANDTDPDGDILKITSIGGNVSGTIAGMYGTLVWNPLGSYTYTPNAGLDSLDKTESLIELFNVNVSDGNGGAAISTLTITITGNSINIPPLALTDFVTVPEDIIDQPIEVLLNDIDPDGDQLTVSIVSEPVSGGTTVVGGGKIVTYNPPRNFNGDDYFIYQICDNGTPSLCDVDTVFITVTPVNDPPEANTDVVVILQNTLTNTTIDVQSNDIDVDGDDLITTIISLPTSGGVATVENNDKISYKAPTNFVGTDTIIYRVCDNGVPVLCDNDTVIIHVIDHLMAIDDAYDVYAGQVDTLNILGNDLFVGNVNVKVINNPVHGTAVLNPDRTIQFTAVNNFIGYDQLTYVISDGSTSDTAVVTIAIHPYTLVLAQSGCIDDESRLEWAVDVTGASVSTININIFDLNGKMIQFIGNTTLVGSIPWPGQSVDGSGNVILPPVNLQTLRIQVSYTFAPFSETHISTVVYQECKRNTVVAVHDAATITKPVQLLRVLDNDYDPDEGDIDPSSLEIVKYKDFIGPYHGNVNVNEDGTITYIAQIRYTGLDSFVYVICDNLNPAACDTAIVRLNVIWDYKLIAADDHFWTYKGQAKTFDVSYNDTDPDDALDLASVKVLNDPHNGTFTIGPDGKIKYTPNTDFVGRDSLYYQICNKDVPPDCDEAWTIIDVVENKQLLAIRDEVSTETQKKVTIPVLINDYDPEGMIDTTSLSIFSYPKHGTVTIVDDGKIDYVPGVGYAGPDSFIYRLCDSGFPSTCDTAIVYIDIIENMQLIAVRDDVTTGAEENVIIPVLINDFDPEGLIDTTSLSIVDSPDHGTVSVLPNGTLDYLPGNGYVGIDSFIYRLCDKGSPATCDTAIVHINILDQNTALVANPDKAITPTNKQIVIPVLNNDYDPDGIIDTLSMEITEMPSSGSVTVQPDGTIIYLPENGFSGNDSFIYRICDNGPSVKCDTALVIISVVNSLPPVAIQDNFNAVDGITNTWEVTLNDYDLDDGLDSASVQIVDNPRHGTATVNHGNGLISYIADDCYFGIDSMTYLVHDIGGNSSNVAKVYVTITINLALDSDGDGSRNVAEDINGNGTPCDDDTDSDLIPNYLDIDDDGDGVLSITEDWDRSGDPSDDDTDGDGIPNFLDTDDDDDTILTLTEDPNHNGNYMDDDTDGNGIINLLDSNDDGDWLLTKDETGDLDGNGVPDYLEVWHSLAQNDSVTIWMDEIVNIPVLDNDSPQMSDSTLIIIQNPIHGNATINKDFTITYSPESGYFGVDTFQYEICDYYAVCDEATVIVNVEDLEFPELFTPNGDGKNDYYVIGGIQKYSNNQFTVFNRWGNKVYEKTGYLNDWNGWANVKFVIGSKELPVGVYYYILRYNDTREKAGALFLER